MKLPFVSREMYEQEHNCTKYAQHIAEKRRVENEQLRADFNALLDKYHSLRSAGASPVSAGLTPELPPHQASDLAIEQVVERFGGNIKLRRKLLQFQAEQRRGNVDEDEIADRLTNWRDPSAADEDAA